MTSTFLVFLALLASATAFSVNDRYYQRLVHEQIERLAAVHGVQRSRSSFKPQACTSTQCTAVDQRTWVGSGAACESCGSGPSTLCKSEYYCDSSSKTCKTSSYTYAKLGQSCSSTLCDPQANLYCDKDSKCATLKNAGDACIVLESGSCGTSSACKGRWGCIAHCIATSSTSTTGICRESAAEGACDTAKTMCGLTACTGTCTLKANDQECAVPSECKSAKCSSVGSVMKCRPVAGLGDSCTDSDDCGDNGLQSGICVDGKCKAYFSVGEGGAATNPVLCQAGLTVVSGKCGTISTCSTDDQCQTGWASELTYCAPATAGNCATGKCSYIGASECRADFTAFFSVREMYSSPETITDAYTNALLSYMCCAYTNTKQYETNYCALKDLAKSAAFKNEFGVFGVLVVAALWALQL